MAITIRSNISSMRAQRSLERAGESLTASTARLSSGLRINSASDDAAGLAIASSLNASSRVYGQAIRNINDGISLLNITEGALSQLSTITLRQEELAEQAANGVYSRKQREALHQEATALSQEYDRILASTKANGVSLLDGTLSKGLRIQMGYGVEGSISLAIGHALSGVEGDGTFAPQRTFSLAGAVNFRNGDLNGDGREDLVVVAGTNPQILLGNGDGTFNAAVSYMGGPTSGNLHLADVDGNNTLDVLLAGSNRVDVLLNNGNGTFTAARSFAGPPAALVIQTGDVDEDGNIDMIVADNSNVTSSTFLLLGNGDGSFKAQRTFPIPAGSGGVNVISDLDRDGNLDFYVVDGQNSQLSVFMGNGDGTFKARRTYSNAGTSSSLYVDINGDGVGDHVGAAYSSTTVNVLYGNSDGSFKAGSTFYSGTQPAQVVTSDLNGDGFMDLVAANVGSSTASVLINNGNGTFKAPTTYANASRVRLGDFNEDGVADLATTNGNTVGILMGNVREAAPASAFIDLRTQSSARDALSTLQGVRGKVLAELGNIGAFARRLTTAMSNLARMQENFVAAESRIKDADVALESAGLIKNEILQQAAASVLAQSNRTPEIALALLR